MQVAQGKVQFINNKQGIFSIKLSDGNLYGFYKNQPMCSEGDTVEFSYTERGRYKNADHSSLKVLGKTSPQTSSSYDSGPSNQDVIRYQAARNSALEFVSIALQHGAVKLPAKQAEQLDVLMDLTMDITDKFFQDAINLGPAEKTTAPFDGDE